ncbi:hypothetical protein [Paraglaciecola chathamensis]|uniref:Uncharacterized protein n=1 Tax=Paraglaciecola agarilytica NO2 TaxID=1125747 RepID=A0ABQ0I1Z2_9ALTE|nr:hypothetical protein [Paraglaciecola agarilytica]GAC03349.1 hypothetical protein GAGA_0484 [Paraglaciecola agarilytica NO2]
MSNEHHVDTLDVQLIAIRKMAKSYTAGLEMAKEFVAKNGGSIRQNGVMTILNLYQETAICFQPYPDIDKFYFEL